MHSKYILPLLLVFTILLAGCAPAAPATIEAPAATAVADSAPVFPLTVTDGAGRELTLQAAPARVVSLAPTNTEIIFAVGAGALLVGDTEYCDYPAEAAELPKIGGYSADTISVETVLSLKPDLVLADATGQETVITALEQAGIQVFSLDAASFEEVYANIAVIGKITDHAADAAALVDSMKARVAAVEAKVAGIPTAERPTVFWEVWDEPLMTAGPNTFSGQMIQMAGGTSIFADLTEDYPQVSAEEIVKRNPAFILGPDTHGDKLTAEQLAGRTGWEGIAAVQNNKIFLIDGNTSSRSGPRIVDALEDIAAALHPDLFK